LLPLLHVLLLSRVLLLQLLRLLLMPLLQLLRFRLRVSLLCQTLMVLLLPLLQLLPLFVLLRIQLLLLLLVFLIELLVPGVGRGTSLRGRKIFDMHGVRGTGTTVFRATNLLVAALPASIGGRMVGSSRFPGWHCPVECSGP